MKKRKVQVGDVIAIPLGAGFVTAKVLYVSQVYKDAILLGVYNIELKEMQMPSSLPDDFIWKVYTSQQSILRGRWHCIGSESLRENQQGLTKRIVGGEVWIEDECLGPATKEDVQNLPRMLGYGQAAVEEKLSKLFARGA